MNDVDGAEALYLRLGDSLGRTAYVLCGDRDAAQDLVQATLAQLIEASPDQVDYPMAYARRTLVNLYLNQSQRARKGLALLPRLVDRTASPGVDDQVVDREAVRFALSLLPERQRAVVVLRYFHDLDDRAVADAVGCSPATVRSLLARARRRMRTALESPDEES